MQDVPVPIVAKAEVECGLPGMGRLVKSLSPRVKLARTTGAQGHVDAWAVARAIYEYCERTEVQAALKVQNFQPNGNKRLGRPKTAHRLVMDEMARQGLVSEGTIKRWVYEWYRPADKEQPASGVAVKLNLQPGCAEEGVLFAVNQNSSRLADWVDELLGGDDETEKQVAEIEEVIDRTSARIGRILKSRILTRKELERMAARLNESLAMSVSSALPLYVDSGPQAKAKHKIGAKSPFEKE